MAGHGGTCRSDRRRLKRNAAIASYLAAQLADRPPVYYSRLGGQLHESNQTCTQELMNANDANLPSALRHPVPPGTRFGSALFGPQRRRAGRPFEDERPTRTSAGRRPMMCFAAFYKCYCLASALADIIICFLPGGLQKKQVSPP